MTRENEAIKAWTASLGVEKVDHSAASAARYGRTLLPNGTAPCCVLHPESRGEVQTIVRIAQEHGQPIYPISGGKNWGYGAACAPTEGAAIVDLGRMNRIVQIDAEMGIAIIEPGVTQQQLYEAVQAEAPEFWVDVTGAGPNATIVGNVSDRGFGHTPYADHMRSTCGMSVVLPDGRLLETGFGHFPGSKARYHYPYGVGPILDGLFSQSNLGVITQIGVWLCPKPETFSFFYVKVPDEARLAECIDALRPLRMSGMLNSAVHIGNDLRVFTSLEAYPWEATQAETPLPEALRLEMRNDSRLGAWNVTGSLTGSPGQVRDARRRLKRATRKFGRVQFVNDRKLALGRWVSRKLEKLGLGKTLAKNMAALVPNYGLLQGVPTDMPLQSLGWRLRERPSSPISDPLESTAGLMWLAPVLPLRGHDATCVLDAVAPIFAAHGFDLPVTLTMLNERSMVAVMNISFDKSVDGEGDRAKRCYDESTDRLLELGYVPYRSSLSGMGHLFSPGDVFWDVARDIRSVLDPGGILAPGRYIPQ